MKTLSVLNIVQHMTILLLRYTSVSVVVELVAQVLTGPLDVHHDELEGVLFLVIVRVDVHVEAIVCL